MTYPTIDRDGLIGEIELPENVGTSGYVKTINGTLLRSEVFGFSLDRNRSTYFIIFIDELFLPESLRERKTVVTPELRMNAITAFINQRAGWFFSYGVRLKNK